MIDPNDPPKRIEEWIKELKRVIKRMPKGVWLFANSAGLSVMALGEDGLHKTKDNRGGMDPEYMIDTIRCDIDGGDW